MFHFRLEIAKILKKIILAFVIIVIINAIPVIFATNMGYDRGLISLESLILIVAIALNFKIAALILGIFLAGMDLVYGISQVYPLFETRNLVEVAEFIPNANKKYLAIMAGYFFLSLLSLILGLWISRRAGKAALLISAALLCAASTFDWANNFSPESEKFFLFDQTLVGGIYFSLDGTRRFANAEIEEGKLSEDFLFWPHENVAKKIWKNSVPPKKLLFVIVESWGMPINRDEYKAQLEKIKNTKNIKIIQEGLVKYGGGTAVAELRELCDIYPNALSFKKIPEKFLANCIPMISKEKGRHSVALHAASGNMYHRDKWYPEIGFDEIYFFDNPIANVDKCYSFPGFCDIDLMAAVKNKLAKENEIFFYWLTLNSHIPYDPRDLKNRNDNFCMLLNIKKRDRCIHFQLIKQFFDEFSDNFGDPKLSGLYVVFVGDHSPPFLGVNIRKYFSKEDMVPFLYLKIETK